MWWSEKNKGSLEVRYVGIPLILFVSKSYIYNKNGTLGGKVYTLHLTPLLGLGIIIPSFLLRKLRKKNG